MEKLLDYDFIKNIMLLIVLIIALVGILYALWQMFVNKINPSELIKPDPLLTLELFLMFTTASETFNLVMSSPDHIAQSLIRYGTWVIGEALAAFYFIRYMSHILADGKIEAKEKMTLFIAILFFLSSLTCTLLIWLFYLESIGTLEVVTSNYGLIPDIKMTPKKFNFVVWINVWCTPVLNIFALILSYNNKKYGLIIPENENKDNAKVKESPKKVNINSEQSKKIKNKLDDKNNLSLHERINSRANNSEDKRVKGLKEDIIKIEEEIKTLDEVKDKNKISLKLGLIDKKKEKIEEYSKK